ncbi:hypothetical protein HYX17_05085 [Candidatus Woesearchaeota archaeon]|nr:hypothetical protein [Candidatus Woesearchaeota archaeon]
MSLRNNLGRIVLASTIGLGLAGCSDNPEYHFDGKIGEDKVIFYQDFWKASNYLVVTKPDGRTIVYRDTGLLSYGNFTVDQVYITKDGVKKIYSKKRNDGEEVVKEAQKQFDDYLNKILEIKKQEGLKNLK